MRQVSFIVLHVFAVTNILGVVQQDFYGLITEHEVTHDGYGQYYTSVPWYAASALYETGGVTFYFPPEVFVYEIPPIIQVTAIQQGDVPKRVDIRVSNLTPHSVTIYAYNGRGTEYCTDDNIQIHIVVISDYA